MLEIGLAERPRREQHDVGRGLGHDVGSPGRGPARLVAAHGGACRGNQRGDQLGIRGRQARHVQLAERIGKQAGDDEPVLQRIAQAGRHLGAVRHHGPVAVRRPGQVHRHDLQVLPARRREAAHRAQVAGVAEHQRGRQQPARQQRLRAVDIGHDGVEQPRALHHAALDTGPLRLVDQAGQQVERPRTRLTLVGVDVVADVVVAHLLRHRGARVVQPGDPGLAQGPEKPAPGLAQHAGGLVQLIPVALPCRLRAQQGQDIRVDGGGIERKRRLERQGRGSGSFR